MISMRGGSGSDEVACGAAGCGALPLVPGASAVAFVLRVNKPINYFPANRIYAALACLA
jgi:hypothetical protein